MKCMQKLKKWGCTMGQVNKSERVQEVYLMLASRVCDGVTPEHYDTYRTWYYQKKRDFAISPIRFIAALAKISIDETSKRISPWHMEHGKRVDDEYEKIKI